MRETSKPSHGTAVNFMLAGSVAAVGRTLAHPFSVLKIQSQSGMPGGRMGTVVGAYWIWRLNGAAGFLRALPASVVRIFPHVGIQYTVFDQYRKRMYLQPEQPNLERIFNTMMAGGIAHNVATLLTHPLDVLKTRMIVQPYDGSSRYYDNEVEAFGKILKNEGLPGIYRGLLPSLMGGFVFSGVMFAAWDFMDCLPWRRRGVQLFMGEPLLLSLMAVSAAHVASHPFDVIRKKVMASSPHLPKGGYTDVKTDDLVQAVCRTFKTNGIRGYFHGTVANLLKVSPQVAAYWIVFKGVSGK